MKDFLRHNGIWALLAAVLLTAILAVASALVPGKSSLLSNVMGVIAYPVQKGVSALGGWMEGQYNYRFRYEELLQENEELKARVAELEEDARQGQEASEENERLRQLLDLREKRRDFTYEAATVLSESTTSWESTLTISKGSVHGVEVNDCVITSTGELVGVVTQVGATWSTVITVIDPELEVGGMVFRTGDLGILESDLALMEQGRLKLTYLPDGAELVSGDQVLTSGRGGVYPSGLVVGAVESVETDAAGMERYAVLTPAADLSGLDEVFVITSFQLVD